MGKFFNKVIINDNQNQKDYSQLSNEELLNQFKSENWELIQTNKEKISLLQEVENRNAILNGRSPATVKEISDPSLLGSYNAYYHTISIRLDDNPYENLDSIIHEGQHANHAYSTTNITQISKEEKMMIDIERYPSIDSSKSFYAYYQEANHQDLYNIYSSELNTNNTAFSFLKNQENRYGDDEKYKEYIRERNDHYNHVYNDLNLFSDAKKNAILETTQVNYDRGSLSQEQYQSIVQHVSHQQNVDSFEQTAKDNHFMLNDMVSEYENNFNEYNQYTEEIMQGGQNIEEADLSYSMDDHSQDYGYE